MIRLLEAELRASSIMLPALSPGQNAGLELFVLQAIHALACNRNRFDSILPKAICHQLSRRFAQVKHGDASGRFSMGREGGKYGAGRTRRKSQWMNSSETPF